MPHVELSPKECAVLREVLAARLLDLRREIHHTDNREFNAFLLGEEDVLVALLARLEQPASVAD